MQKLANELSFWGISSPFDPQSAFEPPLPDYRPPSHPFGDIPQIQHSNFDIDCSLDGMDFGKEPMNLADSTDQAI